MNDNGVTLSTSMEVFRDKLGNLRRVGTKFLLLTGHTYTLLFPETPNPKRIYFTARFDSHGNPILPKGGVAVTNFTYNEDKDQILYHIHIKPRILPIIASSTGLTTAVQDFFDGIFPVYITVQ